MQTSETVKIQLSPRKMALIVADSENEEVGEFLDALMGMIRSKYGNGDRFREFSAILRKNLSEDSVNSLGEILGLSND